MPRHVDTQARQREIARAAFKIARASSLTDVTFRAVAAELGTSTTAVTHYAPARTDLLQLTVSHAFGTRERLASRVLQRLPPRTALSLLFELVLPIHDEARLLARVYLEALTEIQQHPNLRSALAEHDEWLAREVDRILRRLELTVPCAVATDLVITTLDGVMCTAMTSPEAWPAARQRGVVKQLTKLIGAGSVPAAGALPSIIESDV